MLLTLIKALATNDLDIIVANIELPPIDIDVMLYEAQEKLKETIEFVSDMVWSKGKEGEELLVGVGVKDEATGIARVPVDKFEWTETTDVIYYKWKWDTPPNRVEIPTATSIRPDWH